MRLKKCILLLLSGLLFLSACGKETTDEGAGKNQTTGNQEELVYIPEWEEFKPDLGEDVYIASELLLGDRLYYGYAESAEEGAASYVGCKELLSQDEPTVREQGEGYISQLLEGADGTPWCIRRASDQEEGKETWWLEQLAISENEPVRIDISECFEEAEYPVDVVMDENGYAYILGGDIGNTVLKVLDPEGKCVRAVELGNNVTSLEVLKGKGVLLAGYGQSALLFNMQMQEPESFEEISSPNTLLLSAQEDGSLLFTDGSLLKRYQPELREAEEIVNLADCNVVLTYVQDIRVLSDGRIALLIVDWSKDGLMELAFLKSVSPDEVSGQKVLRLGTIMSDTALDTAVADFNKKSSECRIEIVDYYTSDWAAANEKLKQEIASGEGPDLLDMRYLGSELDTYLEKGILEDLAPYLENSDQISREDFLPNMLESFTREGILYCIPDMFTIKTLVGKSSDIGEDIGWTREEFMDYALSLPEDTWLLPYQNKYMMLHYLLGMNTEPFVSLETGESRLDGEEFRKCMEFANHFSVDDPGISYDQIPELLGEGKLKLYEAYIRSMRDLQDYYNYFGEPVTCIGYPTADGTGGAYFQGSGIMLGMNSASTEKEAAWEFISTQLTQAAQQQKIDSDSGSGFPSRKDVLEEYFEKSMEPNYAYDTDGEILLDENGEPVQFPILTSYMTYEDGTTTKTEYFASRPEEVELMRILISSLTESDNTSQEVPNMILEEADAYFSGQKSLDETIAVMQSRMQLYLDEKK